MYEITFQFSLLSLPLSLFLPPTKLSVRLCYQSCLFAYLFVCFVCLLVYQLLDGKVINRSLMKLHHKFQSINQFLWHTPRGAPPPPPFDASAADQPAYTSTHSHIQKGFSAFTSCRECKVKVPSLCSVPNILLGEQGLHRERRQEQIVSVRPGIQTKEIRTLNLWVMSWSR